MTEAYKQSLAVSAAYQEHYAALKRFIASLLLSEEGVEDVAQQAFLNAYTAEQDKAIEQPKPFLCY